MSELTIEDEFHQAIEHHEAGRFKEAEQMYRGILQRQPRNYVVIQNLGLLARRANRSDAAVDLLRRAIELKPDFHEAYCNLGNCLRDRGQFDEAGEAYRKAIEIKADFAEALFGFGVVLKHQGKLDEAIAAWRHAIAIQPRFAHAHSNLVYGLHYLPDYGASVIAQELGSWDRVHAQPLQPTIKPHDNDRDPERRLRIGYVSSDFRASASAHCLLPLLEQHDPRQVELFAYAEVARPDAITARMQRSVPHFRNTVGKSDAQLADKIREDQIDILVDLKLHTDRQRLLVFARKPAPVQVTWLGYPGSTGLKAMDYRLSDPRIDPPGMDESVYSEKTVRLPDSFLCYDPLDGREGPVNPLPALQSGTITFGSLNNDFCKLNERVLDTWAQVLLGVENSRLLLLAPEGGARIWVADCLSKRGIDASRAEFLPRQAHREALELYHRIDIGLDPFPYNGHSTSLDSLWMGVPVITLVGKTAVGRAGWSFLANLGLANLAAGSRDRYRQIAIDLAHDLPRLGELRASLRTRVEASPLMNAPRFARNVESAYRTMWRAWCASPLESS